MCLPLEPEILIYANLPLKRKVMVMSDVRHYLVKPFSVQMRSRRPREEGSNLASVTGPRIELSSPDSQSDPFLTSFHIREVI